MLQSMLTEAQAKLLRDEKEALAEIRLALSELDVPREALDTLQQAILQLDELFLLVVVGEFNAGKSALINALLGAKVLARRRDPHHLAGDAGQVGRADRRNKSWIRALPLYTHPLPLLRELNIVDTPGTNAVIRHHERLTDEFVPRSDLVLFVTSADRPMSESERQFLERIRAWGKKVVMTLNKIDILRRPGCPEARCAILCSNTPSRSWALRPNSFRCRRGWRRRPRPSLTRTRARSCARPAAWTRWPTTFTSRWTMRRGCDSSSPIPWAWPSTLSSKRSPSCPSRPARLNEDKETVTAVESVIAAYDQELKSELGPRLAEVENILGRLQARGLDFFDSTHAPDQDRRPGARRPGARAVRKAGAGRRAAADRGARAAPD